MYPAISSSSISNSAAPSWSFVFNGWLEATYVQATHNGYNWFNALVAPSVIVPAPPSNQLSGEYIVFFPSLNIQVPGSTSDEILQPILEWGGPNPQVPGEGNYWSISAYYYDGATGLVWASPGIQVSQGDTIYSWMEIIASNPPWDEWEIYTEDLNTGEYGWATLDTQTKFTYAELGVLEAYFTGDCSSLPASSPVVFNNVSYYLPNPSWNTYYGPCVTPTRYIQSGLPSCGFNASYSGCRSAYLFY